MLKKLFLFIIFPIFIPLILVGCAPKNGTTDFYESLINKDKLIVGISYNSKPFGYKDTDGKIKGMEADLARELAKRLLGSEKKIEFRDISPQERLNSVMSGDVDMVISTMTITSQRKRLVYFSSPYFVAGQAICVRKNSKIDSHFDLINKRVIVIVGTTGEKNIKRFMPNALIQSYIDNSEALSAFKSNSGDAITTDDSLLQGFVMENKDYIILPERLTKEPYGIAFKKSRQTKALKHMIDQILREIKEDGTLDSIKDKWVTF